MIPRVGRINFHTWYETVDRDGDIVYTALIHLENLPADGRSARRSVVEHHLTEALRRFMQVHRSDRAPGFVRSALFQSGLNRHLERWYRDHTTDTHGDWDINVPVCFHRRRDLDATPETLNVIDRVSIDSRLDPVPPRDIVEENIDDVIERLIRQCGPENAMARMIRRWRRGEISEVQAKYLDHAWAYSYARMAREDPTRIDQGGRDIRITFETRIAHSQGSISARLAALTTVVDAMTSANRYIHDSLRIMRAGSPPRETLSPARVVDLRDWVQRRIDLAGSVYYELTHNVTRCEWQRPRFFTVLTDTRRYRV